MLTIRVVHAGLPHVKDDTITPRPRRPILDPFYEEPQQPPPPNRVSPSEGSNANPNTYNNPPSRLRRPLTESLPKDSLLENLAPIIPHTQQQQHNHNPPKTSTSTTTLTKGVRAFKTFLVKQFDDYQFLPPFSSSSSSSPSSPASVETTADATGSSSSRLSSAAVANSSSCSSHKPIEISFDTDRSLEGSYVNSINITTIISWTRTKSVDGRRSTGLRLRRLSSRFGEVWRQVCQVWVDVWCRIGSFTSSGSRVGEELSIPESPLAGLGDKHRVGIEVEIKQDSDKGTQLDHSASEDVHNNHVDSSSSSNLQPSTASTTAAAAPATTHVVGTSTLSSDTKQHQQQPQPPAIPEQTSVDGVGRSSGNMRGSCMAIIIGLVAGIMWF